MSDETRDAQQTLSEERLVVIRAMLALTDAGDAQERALTELLADHDRILAENAALARDVQDGCDALLRTHRILSQKQAQLDRALAIVRVVADGSIFFDRPVSLDGLVSNYRDKMEQARALLASVEADADAANSIRKE